MRFESSMSVTISGENPIGPSTPFSFSSMSDGKYCVRRFSASMRNATKLVSFSRVGNVNRSCAWKYVRRPSIVASNAEIARCSAASSWNVLTSRDPSGTSVRNPQTPRSNASSSSRCSFVSSDQM